MIEKTQEMNALLDWYESLLTTKQKEVMGLYFKEDYSLSEIGENLNISRSAVSDLIKRTSKILNEYENKLKLVQKYNKRSEVYEKLRLLGEKEIDVLVDTLEDTE